ncbi:MAG: kelch repeat-containing protein, partial [Acidimicrobiales bacterium]
MAAGWASASLSGSQPTPPTWRCSWGPTLPTTTSVPTSPDDCRGLPAQAVPYPSARAFAAAAYDPDKDRVVLFGGQTPKVSDETWIWDGSTWRPPKGQPTVRPAARQGASMAFDGTQLVLFGGADASGRPVTDGTWLWDWNTESWHSAGPSLLSPRYRAAMAFDPAANRVVLFGGYDA